MHQRRYRVIIQSLMDKIRTYLSRKPWSRPRTVLAVDADPVRLEATCRTIGSEYPVLAATCGVDALRTARNVKPDLIVLDIMRPGGMDGCRILDDLNSDPATRDIMVIVVSETSTATNMEFGEDEDSQRSCIQCIPFSKSQPLGNV